MTSRLVDKTVLPYKTHPVCHSQLHRMSPSSYSQQNQQHKSSCFSQCTQHSVVLVLYFLFSTFQSLHNLTFSHFFFIQANSQPLRSLLALLPNLLSSTEKASSTTRIGMALTFSIAFYFSCYSPPHFAHSDCKYRHRYQKLTELSELRLTTHSQPTLNTWRLTISGQVVFAFLYFWTSLYPTH